MAVSCMRNTSGHNCRNSSFIMELAVGHIPYHVPDNVFLVVHVRTRLLLPQTYICIGIEN